MRRPSTIEPKSSDVERRKKRRRRGLKRRRRRKSDVRKSRSKNFWMQEVHQPKSSIIASKYFSECRAWSMIQMPTVPYSRSCRRDSCRILRRKSLLRDARLSSKTSIGASRSYQWSRSASQGSHSRTASATTVSRSRRSRPWTTRNLKEAALFWSPPMSFFYSGFLNRRATTSGSRSRHSPPSCLPSTSQGVSTRT